MDDCSEASLISKLESSDHVNLYSLFSTYLQPFSPHLPISKTRTTAPKSSRSKSKSSSSPSIRDLLKSYLPFLNRSLSSLPKRLCDSPKPSDSAADELFNIYRLCLDCVGCSASLLSCKPYMVQLQTARFIRCLVEWGRYAEAINEGFGVLTKIGDMKLDGVVKSRDSLVPVLVDGRAVDGDLARLIVDVVVRVFHCVAWSKSGQVELYQNLLVLFDEIQPWLSVLDTSTSKKFERTLLSYLNKATRFLARETKTFGANLLPKFCAITFGEYQKLLREQSEELNVEKLSVEFLELLSCCAYECRASCADICGDVAASMNKLDLEPFALISKLYASSFYLSGGGLQSNGLLSSITANEALVQELNSLLKSTENLFAKESGDKGYLRFYLDALKFLCRPLADSVISERKSLLNQVLSSSEEDYLQVVQTSFCQLCDMYSHCHSCSFESERDSREGIDKTVLKISIASFTLSLKLNSDPKKNQLNWLISEECLQYQGIKFLIVSLYDIALDCYRNKHLKESVEAMELCFKASWTHGLGLCQLISGKKKGHNLCVSEDAILDITNKACMATSFFLDLLFEKGGHEYDDGHELGNTIMYSLRKWSSMRDLFEKLPSPKTFVKQWVKIQCKLYSKTGIEEDASTLYTYLESVQEDGVVSKGTISIILEQELSAYQELSDLFPELCRQMQLKIIDILLHKVLVKGADWFEKSTILIKKGRLLRESGREALRSTIHCLSEAIDTIRAAFGKTCGDCSSASNQLAVAYTLRAFAMHEAEPDSKEVLSDIKEAVNIWLNHDVSLLTSNHSDDKGCEHILQLLYHIFDFLSLTGNIYPNICILLIEMCSAIKKPLESCLITLWESRRLSHALCVSPMNEEFLITLSDKYGDTFKSCRHWLSFMKDSQSSLLGFKQNFLIHPTQFSQAYGCDEQSFKPNVNVDDIKEVAAELISNGENDSSFLAGYLYYDLAERLLSTGQLVEALHWAKEAHQLRCKLVQDHFSYVLEYPEERHSEHGGSIRSQPVCPKYFRVCTRMSLRVWPGAALFDSEGCSLTPWKVLQCYLESNLQVGNIQEVIGNGTEAEALFCWGKSISCQLGFSLFNAAFSVGLGKVYHKMCLLELAEKELQSAKKVLSDSRDSNPCLRCSLKMKSTVNELLGNLYRSIYVSSNESTSTGQKFIGELYESSLSTLSEWKAANHDDVLSKTKIKRRSNTNTSVKDMSSPFQSLSKARRQVLKPDNRRSGRIKKEAQRSDLQKSRCTQCFPVELKRIDSLMEFAYMKWELARRRHLLRVLAGLGNCVQDQGEAHGSHKIYSQCTSVLSCRNPFCDCSHSSCTHKLEVINMDISEDVFAVERATVLYDLCWFLLKNTVPGDKRSICCYLSSIELSDVVSLLLRCFILCREVPLLFQKVSRLLATIYVVSTCRSEFSSSLSSSSKLSENHWAAYFHQASVGVRHNNWVLSSLDMKHKAINSDVKAPLLCGTHCRLTDMRSLFRLAPDMTEDVTSFVNDFFGSLPTTTILCLTILGGPYASLLKVLVPHSSSCSWLLVSHFNANSEPVVLLLPLNVIHQDDELGDCSSVGSSVVDAVAPIFKSILHENKSSSVKYSEDTEKNRSNWWTRRKGLDGCLSKLLRDMEESWFGPWKYLILGQWSERQALDSVARKLVEDLKDKCNLDVKESLLKAVLGVVKFDNLENLSIPRVVLEKGCYVGSREACDQVACDTVRGVNENSDEVISRVALELMLAAVNKLEEENGTNRESVILVLDTEVQTLPWENMPILRGQEVYRMPSISSISAVLQKSTQKGAGGVGTSLPLIDPLDAFYLVNPSGDLGGTQAEFEEWFRGQNLEGKAGVAPSSEELSAALKSHDLFLYFGHGSGAQYIPMHEIQKLDKCAASLLMGCSSGSLLLNGSYAPRGIAYSYLSAGSPVVIANLWEVTDKDIDRFGRAVLEAWIAERSKSLVTCVQCSILAEEMSELSLNKKTRNGRKGRGKKHSVDVCVDSSSSSSVNWCRHKVKVGYFVSKARNACKLPYLIGAAPVCYGVPTGIRKKNDI